MEKIEITNIIRWCNVNSGFLSLVLFIATLILGWLSGFFKSIIISPKFRIEKLEQCTFCTIIDLNETYNDLPVHKTAFVVYLNVSNIGNISSSIHKVELGYYKADFKTKFCSKRRWVKQTISKEDFKIELPDSDKLKVYPFLTQRNQLSSKEVDTFLEVGKQITGVAYFEEYEAYGNLMPRLENNDLVDIEVKIHDVFGNKFCQKMKIKYVKPLEAFKYNSYFGQTYKEYVKSNKKK
jgi:hypothetical protein